MKKFLVVFLVMFSLLSLVSCGGKLEWPDGKLGNMIPQIDGVKGEIGYENLDSLYITLEDISENQYLNYIEGCKNKGFSVDVSDNSDSFTAFNDEGYKIDISYFSSGDMWITVDAPISMSNFDWPNSDIAKLLPEPSSNYGKIEWEAEYGFVIYVGNTTKAEYKDYVEAVYARGFTVDYNKGDDYFYADNAEGYSVSLKYEDFNTMFVRIDEPEEEKPETNGGNNNSNNSTENNDNNNNSDTGNNNNTNLGELVNGMRPEFKEAMDSYEAFFDEYCTFMKKYNSSSNPTSMLSDYMSFISRYAETMTKLNEISDDEMNSAELLYYTEVMARINQKLLDVN